MYLDSTSLKSLLISQRDTLPSEVTKRITHSDEAEVLSKMSAGNDFFGKAEVGARISTAAGSDFSATRKAEIQTLFKELKDLPGLPRRLAPDTDRENQFARGDLIEIEVELSPDPTYELIALLREFGGLAEAAPHIMGGAQMLESLEEVRPIMKMLDQLMAGLIPIRGRVLGHVVTTESGQPQVRKTSSLTPAELKASQPLLVVGVTEYDKFWRDPRRVIFSHAKYTVMARIARDGIQQDWSPVKGADLFYDLVPELKSRLTELRLPKSESQSQPAAPIPPREKVFTEVLTAFKDRLIADHVDEWTEALGLMQEEVTVHS